MKDVRLPKGASVTMSRDDVRSLSKGGGWGAAILAFAIVAVLMGGNDDTAKTPTNTPRPSVSTTVGTSR